MSSGPPCRYEKRSCERATSPTLQYSLCRASSARMRLRWILAATARLTNVPVSFGTLIICAIVIHNYDPSQGRGLDLNLRDREGNSLGKKTTIILPEWLWKSAKLSQTTVRNLLQQNDTLEKVTARIASILDSLHIRPLLEDPPPQAALAACVVSALAIGVLQYSHKADRYFNRILVSGLVVGSAAAFLTTNVLIELKNYLAWSTILALLLSVFVHWAMRLWQGPQILDDGSEMIVHLDDKSCGERDSPGVVVRNESQR